jgi:hypothetical protein
MNIRSLPVWNPHPDEFYEDEPVVRTLASGTQVLLDADGTPVMRVGKPVGFCSICDGLGHGYPGAGPCPLEERGSQDPRF